MVNSAGDRESDDPGAGGRLVEARRGQLAMAAVPGGDGDGAARSGPAPGQPPHRLTSREGKWLRLAARRAHVALPPDRITKAGLPTSGPRGRCCWPKSRSTATRDHPEIHRRNWEPGNPAWFGVPGPCSNSRKRACSARRNRRSGGSTGLTRGRRTHGRRPGRGVRKPRGRASPEPGRHPSSADLIVQEDAAFVHVARTVTPQQMAEARMCWPIPPGGTCTGFWVTGTPTSTSTASGASGHDITTDARRHW